MPEPTPRGQRTEGLDKIAATRITFVIEASRSNLREFSGADERYYLKCLQGLARQVEEDQEWHLTVTGGSGNTQLYYNSNAPEDSDA